MKRFLIARQHIDDRAGRTSAPCVELLHKTRERLPHRSKIGHLSLNQS